MDKVNVVCQYVIRELMNNIDRGSNGRDWEVSSYPLNGSSCEEDLSGIFIATVMYFIVQECPVYIPFDQLSNMKQKFALWLIEGLLPI
jgi:hypothetical protein